MLLQPLIDLRTGDREIYEVAPLLPIPGGDHIPRSSFLEHARTAKLLDQIDRRVIEHALGLIDERRREGEEVRLLIRQSAAALAGCKRIEWLRERLRARHLVGTGLSLAFDLADLGTELRATTACSELLSKMGVSLSLAGFDADAAAFDALGHLPVEYVELRERVTTPQPGGIASVIEALHALGVKVIAADDNGLGGCRT